ATAIGAAAGVPVHISHFHTPASEAWRLMDWMAEQGVRGTFDAYPYTRGCSLLAMTMLPPRLNALETDQVLEHLRSPQQREALRREWFPQVAQNPSLGPDWPELITIAHTGAPEHSWAPGLTLTEIAHRLGTDPVDAALDLLLAARLDVNVVMAVHDQRPPSDLGRLFAHPGHLGGSDGIFIGAHPHPRARGTFAAFLATYVRDRGDLSWADAVQHLSTSAADVFALGDRGRLRPGAIADIAVIDPVRVRDTATYENPRELADGVDDVLVAGVPVLAGGELTGALPGGGVRAAPPRPCTRQAGPRSRLSPLETSSRTDKEHTHDHLAQRHHQAGPRQRPRPAARRPLQPGHRQWRPAVHRRLRPAGPRERQRRGGDRRRADPPGAAQHPGRPRRARREHGPGPQDHRAPRRSRGLRRVQRRLPGVLLRPLPGAHHCRVAAGQHPGRDLRHRSRGGVNDARRSAPRPVAAPALPRGDDGAGGPRPART